MSGDCVARQLLANDGLTDVELVGAVQASLLVNLQRLKGAYTQSIEVTNKTNEEKKSFLFSLRRRRKKRIFPFFVNFSFAFCLPSMSK
jgi:hypothetical protein